MKASRLPVIALDDLERHRIQERIVAAGYGISPDPDPCLSCWRDGREVVLVPTGVTSTNAAAIGNEWRVLELLLQHPHPNVLAVYGVFTDAPDRVVRLVMAHCSGGSLDKYLDRIRESGEVL